VEALLTEAFMARIESGVTMLPGAAALLEALRAAGVPAGLVSASPRPVVDLVLERIGSDRFKLSVSAGDSVRSKPAPDPYLAAACQMGLDPASCVAIEDSPPGILSARAAGCVVVAVGPPGARAAAGPAGPRARAVPGGVVTDGVAPGGIPDGVVAVPTLESVDLVLLRHLVRTRR
jgi:HAD superfamily hydrolase (TIGR01509 family)